MTSPGLSFRLPPESIDGIWGTGWAEEPLGVSFRRLWSLSDMVANFRLSALIKVNIGLNTLIMMSSNNQTLVENSGGYGNRDVVTAAVYQKALADTQVDIGSLTQLTEAMFRDDRSPYIDRAIADLRRWAAGDTKRWSDLRAAAISLRNAVETELSQHIYYKYPKGHAQKVTAFEDEWGAVITAFPSATHDAFSATDCYAMGHYTASVFHCMRVLEHGLAALAEHLGLVFDVQQWNTIIEQIEAKIAEQRRTMPRGMEKNARLQFLSEAAKEFFHFKDGWRNYVSHNRGHYDQYSSAGILEHTRTFMQHLASRLGEEQLDENQDGEEPEPS